MIGDSEGMLHYISRQLESRKVAEAHLAGIIQIKQLKQSPYLVTLGVGSHLSLIHDTHFIESEATVLINTTIFSLTE